jgi:geranylgeranyl transferase type-2 subunit beta
MSRMRRMDRACCAGAAGLGAAVLEPLRAGVLAHRQPDGGFRGREGGSDAWYTAFALRCLELTGGIPQPIASAAAGWLADRRPQGVRQALDHATIARLTGAALVAAAAAEPASTVYDAFAGAVLADLCRRMPPHLDLGPLRRGDGFAESTQHAEAQVPATAAAITVQLLHGRRDLRACRFLTAQQVAGGGVRVHAGAPVPDLLSTATATWALAACRQLHLVDRSGLARFAVACRTADGFAAVPGDPQSDPEYTWYGLTLLALLRRHAAPGLVGWLRRRGWAPP